MSDMLSQTFQGAVLSIVSSVLAQIISSYRDDKPFSFNIAPIVKFAVFSIISNPPNILWQIFLEKKFPTQVSAAPKTAKANGQTRVSKTNVATKFILDQTIGATVNTWLFLAYMGYFNDSGARSGWDQAKVDIQNKTYPMLLDGYKLWPLFSLISFLWIPVDKRVVAGCAVGVGWNTYLSLMVGS